jgi:hypothetical protein
MGRIKDDGVKWIGEPYEQDQSEIKELKKRHSLEFFK